MPSSSSTRPAAPALGDFGDLPMPTPASEINLIETFADTKVIGLTINHENMTDAEVTRGDHPLRGRARHPRDRCPHPADRGARGDMVLAAFPQLERGADRRRPMTAPRLEIDLDQGRPQRPHARRPPRRAGHRGHRGHQGDPRLARGRPATLVAAGVTGLGDSRIENIEALRRAGVTAPITLIRSPDAQPGRPGGGPRRRERSTPSSTSCGACRGPPPPRVGSTASCSWSSSVTCARGSCPPTSTAWCAEARAPAGPRASPGSAPTWPARAAWSPSDRNMGELSDLVARSSETSFGVARRPCLGRQLRQPRLGARRPADVGRVNDLRLGESILLGREPLHRRPVDGLHTDAFTLVGEVIESKVSRRRPWGDIAQTAFGDDRDRPATGARSAQAILALGAPGRRPRRAGTARRHRGPRRQQRPPGPRHRRRPSCRSAPRSRFQVDYAALLAGDDLAVRGRAGPRPSDLLVGAQVRGRHLLPEALEAEGPHRRHPTVVEVPAACSRWPRSCSGRPPAAAPRSRRWPPGWR